MRFPRVRPAIVLAATAAFATAAFAVDPATKKLAKDPDSFKRSDAARALGKEGTPEAAEILADLFEDKNPYVRDAAVEACDGITTGPAAEVLAKACSSRDELTRRNAASALGRTKTEAALVALAKLARKDPSAAVRTEALDALWEFRRNADALAVARDAAADSDAGVRAAAIEAAGRIGGDGAADVVKRGLADADEGVRCVARMEMRYVARDEALGLLATGASDPSWRIRAQTVEDAAWLREAPAMDALVKLVGDATGRVSGAAHHVLTVLSQKDFGRDPELWKSWWEQNRASWKAPRGKFDELKPPAGGATTSATYHGLEIASAHVAFVIDFSGSMKDPLPRSTAGARVDVARRELMKAVQAMPDGAKANVLLFQLQTKRCFDRAPALSDRSRKEIESFLRATPGERGNLLDGVLTAVRDDDVDTIFLLSDGAPSTGEMVDKTRVQAAIRQANRTRKIAIHTIGFGAEKATERSFLEGVAREGGGRSVFQ